jgi:hypothetical protein
MKNEIKKIVAGFLLVFAMNFLTVENASAQCPMCKMSAESNMKNGGTAGKGLNSGILYLFAAPYLMVGGIAYLWFRNSKKRKDTEEERSIQELLD